MKNLINAILTIVIIILISSDGTIAQNDGNPLLVTIHNKVKMADMPHVNKMVDSILTPVLKELVDEKMIYSFGHFTHSWGDEWNMNSWYVTQDLSSFDKFWQEYRSRVSEKHPDAWGEIVKYIQEHKDNIYRIRDQYPKPANN